MRAVEGRAHHRSQCFGQQRVLRLRSAFTPMLRSQIPSRPPLWMLCSFHTSIQSGAAHLHTTQSTQVPLRSRRTRSSSQVWLWLKRSSLLMHKLRPTARPSTARIRMRSAQDAYRERVGCSPYTSGAGTAGLATRPCSSFCICPAQRHRNVV